MSITKFGVKGYEYQYKVTVFIALIVLAKNDCELFIENLGSEDAELKIIKETNTFYYEIQVKREKSIIDFKKLSEWLCHFQERKSDNNLLYRISNHTNRRAFFISQSRCSDDTLILKNDILNINIHNDIKVNSTWENKFLTSVQNNQVKTPETNLLKERNKFCLELGSNIKNLSDTLKRIIIWEELDEQQLDNRVSYILNKTFKIPQSLIDDILPKLIDEIRNGRDQEINIIPKITELISKYQINMPQISTDYQIREEEKNLLEELKNKNIILLTGVTFCGKSELAKKIANNFTSQGFNYLNTSDITELERFLNINKIEDKIAILEDPWGHISIDDNSYSISKKLENIIKNQLYNHKIIVTSKIEVIYELNNCSDLQICKINQLMWHDLTIKDNKKLLDYWSLLVNKKHLVNITSNSINEILSKNEKEFFLQLGQLNHLSNMDKDELSTKNLEELLHIARINSKELADNIRNKNSDLEILMAILSLTCNTIFGISLIDLAYIFSNDNGEYSILESQGFTISSGLNENDEKQFPKYLNKYLLHEKIEDALALAEQRGYVIISNNNIYFKHPNYFETGRYLLFSQSHIKEQKILKYLKKCISCLNLKASFLASKQIQFMYKSLSISNIGKQCLKEIAFYGLRSIFPSVADNCHIFLSSIFSELTLEEQEKLVIKIQQGYTNEIYISWWENIPFIQTNVSSNNRYKDLKQTNFKYIQNLVNIINSDKNISLKNIWELVIFWKSLKGYVYDDKILNFLLETNEVFIRSNVAYLITSRLCHESYELILKIFSDEHPSVIFKAISGILYRWVKLSPDLQAKIYHLLIKSFENKSVAIRAYNLISTFGIDYGSESLNWRKFTELEKKELWNLWAKLFPICSSQIPLNVFFNSGRFGHTMDQSIKYISAENALEVAKAWFNRIDYKLKSGSSIDEYELSFSDYLLEIPKDKNNPSIWESLFDKIINYNHTSFILSSLKWIIEKWSLLEQEEKNKIFSLLRSERKDARWIKATLLNSYEPPKEIIKEILGEENIFEKETNEILKIFPQQLLEDCLSIYSGHPGYLYYLALHGKNRDFWIKIIQEILLKNFESGFDICLRKMLSTVLNSPSKDWKMSKEIWFILCINPEIEKEKLFNELLKWTILNNSIECSEYWKRFFLALFIDKSKKGQFINKIIEYIDLIEGYHNDTLAEKLGKEVFFDEILPNLNPDFEIFSYLFPIVSTNEINDPKIIDKIEILIMDGLPKSKVTVNFVNYVYKELNHDKKVEVNYSKNNIYDKVKVFEDEYELDDWIH